MSISKTISNMLSALLIIIMLAGASNAYAMQKQKPKRKARCASGPSQLRDAAVPDRESKQPARQKLKLQAPKEDFSEEEEEKEKEGLESELPEDGEQDPMDSVYINNPSMALAMEDAELFANNGAILNAEFEEIFALIEQERRAKAQAKRAQSLAYAQAQMHMQTNPQAVAQQAAYQQFLHRQAFMQQRQVRAMQPQTFACQNCTYINPAHLHACFICGQAR
jgi:hypothetical protein